jgi:hypothetical protein
MQKIITKKIEVEECGVKVIVEVDYRMNNYSILDDHYIPVVMKNLTGEEYYSLLLYAGKIAIMELGKERLND